MRKDIRNYNSNNGDRLKLLAIFGFCGRNIMSFKKTKALFAVIGSQYEPLLRIKWDRDFFGPFSEEITSGFAELQKNMWLGIYEREYPSGLYYFYELSKVGNSYFDSNLENLKTILESIEIEPKEFASDCFVWNHLPCKYVFNEALTKRNIIEKAKNGEFNQQTRQGWWRADVSFDEDDLEKLPDLYKKQEQKIILKRRNGNHGHHTNNNITFKIEVVPDLPSEKYKYLSPNRKYSRKEYEIENYEFPMEIFGTSEKELEDRVKRVRGNFDGQIEKYQKEFDEYIEKLEKFWEKANSCTDGVELSFDNYGYVYVTINTDLKREIGEEDWDLGYLNHVFHILRPFDRF